LRSSDPMAPGGRSRCDTAATPSLSAMTVRGWPRARTPGCPYLSVGGDAARPEQLGRVTAVFRCAFSQSWRVQRESVPPRKKPSLRSLDCRSESTAESSTCWAWASGWSSPHGKTGRSSLPADWHRRRTPERYR
jgi:hypothetical protein